MRYWLFGLLIIVAFGCQSVKSIRPSDQELQVKVDFNKFKYQESDSYPLHTIRVNIHVIQDSLGQGNFTIVDSIGDNAPGWYWLKGLVEDASKRMGELHQMNMPTTSPHIKDSRIRFEVVGVYAWQNQALYDLHTARPNSGNAMYDFIMEQDIEHKEDALQLFIAGANNRDGGKIASRGIASGAPDKRWTVLFNYHTLSLKNRQYWPATLIAHEIGHNLGLRHTWNQNDRCDDTPMNPYHRDRSATSFQCWALNEPANGKCDEIEKCSNNMMDYNAYQNALTECQVAQIHYNIYRNRGNLQDIIYTSDKTTNQIEGSIAGNKTLSSTSTYRLNAETLTDISWYVTPRDAVMESIGKGNVADLEPNPKFKGKATLTFMIHQSSGEDIFFEKPLKIKAQSTEAQR